VFLAQENTSCISFIDLILAEENKSVPDLIQSNQEKSLNS